MDHPLITIGITAYNAADTIARAVDSALDQDWDNTEIIVVDDASTDQTLSILEPYKGRTSIIKHPKNKGVAAARNTLLQHAQGEFIAFFDDDDQSLPERLTTQYQRITDYEQDFQSAPPIICHAARIQNYPDGQQRTEPTTGEDPECPLPQGPDMAKRILFGRPILNGFGSMATCAQMARTKIYRDLGGFDETFRRCEDTDFNVRLALSGGHFLGIKKPMVVQTMTHGSDKTRTAEFHFYQRLLDKHRAFIEQHISFDFCRAWLQAKHVYMKGQRFRFFMKLLTLLVRYPVYTVQRLLWAFPNIKFNHQFKTFLKSSHHG